LSAGACLAAVLGLLLCARHLPAQKIHDELLRRTPYDLLVIQVDEETTEQIQIEPLDFGNPAGEARTVPEFKKGSVLEVRLLNDPDEVYEVTWKDVALLQLYEELLVGEANLLVAQDKLDDAFEYFTFLSRHYPRAPKLEESISRYLYLNAQKWFNEQRVLESLSLLEELYQRNPGYDHDGSGLTVVTAIDAAAEQILNGYIKAGSTLLAGQMMDRLIRTYGTGQLPSVQGTVNLLNQMALSKRDEARQLMVDGKLREAQKLSREMLEIFPRVAGGRQLAVEIARRYPLVIVGVTERAVVADRTRIDNWSARRAGYLVRRTLLEYQGPGPEKGEYRFPMGTLRQANDRRSIHFSINPGQIASQFATDGYAVSRKLLEMADPSHPNYRVSWARLFSHVDVENVFDLEVHFRRPHVLPEAILQVYIDSQLADDDPGRIDGPFVLASEDEVDSRYRANPNNRFPYQSEDPDFVSPAEIVERLFEDNEKAVRALKAGEVDVLDHLSPVDAIPLMGDPSIRVKPYALPTVHMLIPNMEREHMQNDLVRKAVVFGIRRDVILDDLLMRGHRVPGCRLISGPFAAGISREDPLSYAYDQTIQPREYLPRLAVTLFKLAERRMKEDAEKKEEKFDGIPPLVIAHPANRIARVACRTIQFHLNYIKIACTLKELPAGMTRDLSGEYDLLYCQLAMWEPIVDAGTLLGTGGLAMVQDDHVNRSLQWLESAMRWQDVRDRVRSLHRVCHDKVTVIPLWQMVDYYAHHSGIQLNRRPPVSLYHGVQQWQLAPSVP
jgi:tetratricopeptide (TPR) repeat protein